MKNKFLYASFLTAILLGLFVLIGDADAQTKRRKKKAKPRAVAANVQTQPAASPEVVRDVYLDGNQIVLGETPQQPETASESVGAPIENQIGTVETESDARIRELSDRIKSLESNKKNEYDEKQKRLLMNLDILSRAETRAESLRKQLFEIIEKESNVRTRLEQIQADARPEAIERSTAFVGSMRPEEIRDQRKKSLEAERRNLDSLLTQIQTNRTSLEESVQKADFLVEKVRLKLDKDIDDALTEKEEDQ